MNIMTKHVTHKRDNHEKQHSHKRKQEQQQ